MRRGGLRVGRRGERLAQIGARLADQRAAVAGADDGAEQRRVGEPAGEVGAGQRGADGGAEQRRRGDLLPRVGVEPAQLAGGVKARQPRLELLDHRLRGAQRRARCGQQPHLGAHCREGELHHVY